MVIGLPGTPKERTSVVCGVQTYIATTLLQYKQVKVTLVANAVWSRHTVCRWVMCVVHVCVHLCAPVGSACDH